MVVSILHRISIGKWSILRFSFISIFLLSFCLKFTISTPEWRHLVSDVNNTSIDTPVKINQDANIYVTQLKANESNTLTVEAERQGYLLCIEGSSNFTQLVDGHKTDKNVQLQQHDAAEIKVLFNILQSIFYDRNAIICF